MADANGEEQVHCQSDHEDKRLCSVSGNKDEKLPDSVSLVNNEDTVVNDDNTIHVWFHLLLKETNYFFPIISGKIYYHVI